MVVMNVGGRDFCLEFCADSDLIDGHFQHAAIKPNHNDMLIGRWLDCDQINLQGIYSHQVAEMAIERDQVGTATANTFAL